VGTVCVVIVRLDRKKANVTVYQEISALQKVRVKKIHGVEFSWYGPSTKILTHGENMEEYGRDWCIRGCHIYHEIW